MASAFYGMTWEDIVAVLGEPFACVAVEGGEVWLYCHEDAAGVQSVEICDGMAAALDFAREVSVTNVF